MDETHLTERQQKILWALAEQSMGQCIDEGAPAGLDNASLAKRFDVTVDEIKRDIEILELNGLVEFEESPVRDPIKAAVTDPDT